MTATVRERESNKGANKPKSLVIGFVVLLVGYFWGGMTVYKNIFPIEQIRYVKNALLGGSLQEANQSSERNTIFQTFSPQVSVVMIGDSITARGEWNDMFPQIKIANRGIGGDRADYILLRMEPIFAVNAKKAFLMVGINDIYRGQTISTIFENYTNIVRQLKKKGIEVYIQSTLECNKSKCGNKLQQVRELNGKLKAYAKEQNLTYININAQLTTEADGLLSQFSFDGIHLLGNGYLKWAETLAPYM